MNYLPELNGLEKGVVNGRNIYQGYQRGWGLQFTDLPEKILQDSIYREAFELALERTILIEPNWMNIFLILKYFLSTIPNGHIIEFGAFRGGNAIFMASVVSRLYPGVQVYALDTYTGMPPTDKSLDAHNEGDFSDTDYEELKEYIRKKGIDNLHLVKGRFEDTAPILLEQVEHVALAHIDCDIYPSVKYSYEVVKEYMVEGGYIVLDDATVSSCIGATQVVEDVIIRRDGLNSEQIYPHYVFRNYPRNMGKKS